MNGIITSKKCVLLGKDHANLFLWRNDNGKYKTTFNWMGFYLMVFIFNVKLPVSCQKTYQSNAHSRDRVQKNVSCLIRKDITMCVHASMCVSIYFFLFPFDTFIRVVYACVCAYFEHDISLWCYSAETWTGFVSWLVWNKKNLDIDTYLTQIAWPIAASNTNERRNVDCI